MESCDNCNDKCKYVDECINDMYNAMLKRCGIEQNQNENKNEIKEDIEEETGIGSGIGFERIRRITGYLVGSLERFNDGKAAEVRDRTNEYGRTEDYHNK